MNVSFTITVDDLIAFNLHHLRHSPTARRNYWRSLLLPPVIWILLCLGLSRLAITPERSWLQSIGALLPLFMGALVYVAIFPPLRKRAIRRQLRGFLGEGDNSSVLGPRRIEVTPEGVCETAESGQTQCTWKAIKRVDASDEHIMLYRSSTLAFIVPKRSFVDQAQLTAFMDEVNRYRRAAMSE